MGRLRCPRRRHQEAPSLLTACSYNSFFVGAPHATPKTFSASCTNHALDPAREAFWNRDHPANNGFRLRRSEVAVFQCRWCRVRFESREPVDDPSRDSAGSCESSGCFRCGGVADRVDSLRGEWASASQLTSAILAPQRPQSSTRTYHYPRAPSSSSSRIGRWFGERRALRRKLAENTICPKCHFGYGWNGKYCTHCLKEETTGTGEKAI
jgi:hypothetical protein